MSNLLLITDVARLRKIFGRLTEDKNIRLRVVNNLEKGAEEIAIEKPDIVFVQTHLSGLSADILLMHLKKQLGRKRSRFVLLASPRQINDVVLKPYQGWLDTSTEDGELLSDLRALLIKLLSKPKRNEEPTQQQASVNTDLVSQQFSSTDSSVLPASTPVAENTLPPENPQAEIMVQVATTPIQEPSLEEQGLTYAPRQRLKVYSEFNSSFDNAVSNTQEPEPVEPTPPAFNQNWSFENIETVVAKPTRSKRALFLLWLAPVVLTVVAITYYQQRSSTKTEQKGVKTPATVVEKAVTPPPSQSQVTSEPPKIPTAGTTANLASPKAQDKLSDKSVMNPIPEKPATKSLPVSLSAARPTTLPDFIPRYAFDKQFTAANPGWERYKGQVTEFKVLREAKSIKAIQVIDRGGNGVPESFMRGVLRQVAKNPILKPESSEKNDGYEIQRGSVSENIKVVYYRDENGGKLRAFVLTWQ